MDRTAKPRFPAISAGFVCLDIFPGLAHIDGNEFDRNFIPGRAVEIDATTFATGGSVSNTGMALVKLGIETRLIGRIGKDPYGEILQQIYRQRGKNLADDLHIIPDEATGHTYVIDPNGQERRFLFHPGSNDHFGLEDVPGESLDQAGLFHFGYPSSIKRLSAGDGNDLTAIYLHAKQKGLTTSMDTSMPDPTRFSGQADWKNIFRKVLPYTDLFLPSFEEILFMLDRERFERLNRSGDVIARAEKPLIRDLADQLLEMGAGIVMLKLGYRGLYLRTAKIDRLNRLGRAAPSNLAAWEDLMIYQPSYKVSVAGTTGAGDACIAGLLAAFLRDTSPDDAVKAANGAGACCCEKPDAFSGIQSWEQMCDRIDNGWEIVQEI